MTGRCVYIYVCYDVITHGSVIGWLRVFTIEMRRLGVGVRWSAGRYTEQALSISS